MHYDRWRRRGDPNVVAWEIHRGRPVEERFWSKVRKTERCWEWLAGRTNAGYGVFYDGQQTGGAHRFAYEFVVGPIPDKHDLDHLCRNRSCVNPAHLEPVTRAENLARGAKTLNALAAAKTHCSRGHKFTPENTQLVQGKYRRCRTCTNENARRYRSERREMA